MDKSRKGRGQTSCPPPFAGLAHSLASVPVSHKLHRNGDYVDLTYIYPCIKTPLLKKPLYSMSELELSIAKHKTCTIFGP